MKHKRQVYLLNPQELPPETIAVTFAKTSRSPESFREIAAGLTNQKSAEFNEKWVVGYGHSSVAEHAVLHVAVENISRLAVENLESNRLASYTEKSTRYQTWDVDAFFIPLEFQSSGSIDLYRETCSRLLSTYQSFIAPVIAYYEKSIPKKEGETIPQRDRAIRSMAIDVCRFLLPAASLANVGMTINARALEHALGKMLSSPLQEVRDIGGEIKETARESIPTLLKYADKLPYLGKVDQEFENITVSEPRQGSDWCTLINYDPDAVDELLAASFYSRKLINYTQSLDWVRNASEDQKNELIKTLLCVPDRHTIPVRELENVSYSFDLLMDQGAYFEVKRHRMMSQIPQALTPDLGYVVPRAISEAGVLDEYHAVMCAAREAYKSLYSIDRHAAAYVVPNGYNRRVFLNLNLRSAIHFIKLRSASNAHFSVRRVAQRMAEEISRVHPEFREFLGNDPGENSSSIECNFFLSA